MSVCLGGVDFSPAVSACLQQQHVDETEGCKHLPAVIN